MLWTIKGAKRQGNHVMMRLKTLCFLSKYSLRFTNTCGFRQGYSQTFETDY
uniref:Uncharacterized protein n=1 Tax=Arundo donax TaxID=35708 RepID=A0A0A9AA51_ARUDO